MSLEFLPNDILMTYWTCDIFPYFGTALTLLGSPVRCIIILTHSPSTAHTFHTLSLPGSAIKPDIQHTKYIR